MSKQSFDSFIRNAAKHLIHGKVKLEGITEREKEVRYHFKVADYSIYLYITPTDKGFYKKKWGCICHHGSGAGVKYQIECNHVISCQAWLVLNSIKSLRRYNNAKKRNKNT